MDLREKARFQGILSTSFVLFLPPLMVVSRGRLLVNGRQEGLNPQ